GGAFHPAEPQSPEKLTLAPHGGSASNIRFKTCEAAFGSTFGGIRSDNLSAVNGRSILPALPTVGKPSAPSIDSAGRQSRLRINWAISALPGPAPGTNGNSSRIEPPSTSAAAAACCSRSAGTSG